MNIVYILCALIPFILLVGLIFIPKAVEIIAAFVKDKDSLEHQTLRENKKEEKMKKKLKKAEKE